MKILITEKQFERLIVLSEDFKSQKDKFIQQGYSSDTVDNYINYFKEIKDRKYKEADADIEGLNVPKGNARYDIDKYQTFEELELLVDYVRGQRQVGTSDFSDIEVNGEPIFKNKHVEIYYADSAKACIEYKGNRPYGWCISRKEGGMYYTYRLKQHEPAFYFVKRIKATNDEFKIWNLKSFAGKFNDKYHFFVLQVVKNAKPNNENERQYIVTSAANDGDVAMSWNDILDFAPELKGLNEIFQPKPLTEKEREKIEKYRGGISNIEFMRLPYEEKKFYIDVFVDPENNEKLLSTEQFQYLPADLKNHYIGLGTPLTKEQFELIKNDSKLLKRYKQIAYKKFELYVINEKIIYSDKFKTQLLFAEEYFEVLPDAITSKAKNLYLNDLPVKSLGNLIKVEEDLFLAGTKIEDLGNLKEVGENLILQNTPIQSLGNLEYVGRGLDLRSTPIKSLGKLKEVGMFLNLQNTPIQSLGKLKEVGGYLDLQNTPIQSLGNLEKVRGDLGLRNTQIQSLGKLKEVGESLNLGSTPIQSLSDLEKVGEYLNLQNTQIKSLGKLEHVGDKIFIKNTPLSKNYSIRQLEEMYPQFIGKFVS